MKKMIVASLCLFTVSMCVQAKIVKPNVFQKTFTVARTAINVSVVGLKVVSVPSLLEVTPNPDYEYDSNTSYYDTTVLEKATVVQASLRYTSSDSGETLNDQVNVNFELADFSAEEIAIIKGHNFFKKFKLMKAKIAYSFKKVTSDYKYEFCADRFFDVEYRPMSECPRIETRTGQTLKNKMTVSLK